jgi:hypothetical protein
MEAGQFAPRRYLLAGRVSMSKKRTKIIHDAWDTYVTETDDGPLFISFDVEAAREDLTDTLGQSFFHLPSLQFTTHQVFLRK